MSLLCRLQYNSQHHGQTLAELAARAEKTGRSQLEVVEQIYDGRIPDIKPPIKHKLQRFVKAIRDLRTLANKVLHFAM